MTRRASAIPSRRTALTPGRRVAVARSRPGGQADTVLFIHGAGGRKDQWREVWPAFSGRARLLAWDAPGHGHSPAPADASALAQEAWVDDAEALLKGAGGGRTVVVAHSYGTRVALALLARQAKRSGREGGGKEGGVAAALLLGPPGPATDLTRGPLQSEPLWKLIRMRPELERGFRMAAWSPHADPALVAEEERAARRNRLSTMQALFRGMAPDPVLAEIAVPVSILAGADDRLTPPEGAQALADALLHGSCTVLQDCGHQIMLERPQAVRAELGRLLTA